MADFNKQGANSAVMGGTQTGWIEVVGIYIYYIYLSQSYRGGQGVYNPDNLTHPSSTTNILSACFTRLGMCLLPGISGYDEEAWILFIMKKIMIGYDYCGEIIMDYDYYGLYLSWRRT